MCGVMMMCRGMCGGGEEEEEGEETQHGGRGDGCVTTLIFRR